MAIKPQDRHLARGQQFADLGASSIGDNQLTESNAGGVDHAFLLNFLLTGSMGLTGLARMDKPTLQVSVSRRVALLRVAAALMVLGAGDTSRRVDQALVSSGSADCRN